MMMLDGRKKEKQWTYVHFVKGANFSKVGHLYYRCSKGQGHVSGLRKECFCGQDACATEREQSVSRLYFLALFGLLYRLLHMYLG